MAVGFSGCGTTVLSQIKSNHKFYPSPTYNTAAAVSPEITAAFEKCPLSWGEAPPHN